MIACKTTIGYGAPTKAGKASSHGSPLGADEIKGAREKLGWSEAPFQIPADVLTQWRAAGQRGKAAHKDWDKRLAALPADRRAEFERRMKGDLPGALNAAIRSLKEKLHAEPKEIATRTACEFALESIIPAVPEMIGGSADLTGSNNTRTKSMKAITPTDFSGRFVHWGIREHGMAAAMNGMVLHRGIIPYSGTFLVFADYCRPSIRLAALMGERVIHVMTHDSIGLGEDGPTHQPVEHLASLRAIPNLNVFRPCDAVETVECWQLALEGRETPSVLALTRQNLPQLRRTLDERNKCVHGAYEISPAQGQGGGLDLRHRFRGVARRGGAEAPRRPGRAGPRGVGPLLRTVPGGPGRRPPRGDRRRARQSGRRGRGPAGLGRPDRLGRRLCRHEHGSAPAPPTRSSITISA